jgi:hypothetical protein
MLISRSIKSAAVLALLTIGFAAPVQAQNNKQIISGTWYEDRANGNNSTLQLVLTFAQTPADKFLNVTNVSCAFAVGSIQVVDVVSLQGGTTSGAGDIGRPYSILGNVNPQTINNSKFYSIVQNGIFYKFGPGRFPSIFIDSQSTGGGPGISGQCTIVGNLTDD